MTPRFIARQLSCPSGYVGRIIGHLMNRRNAKMNAFAVRHLEVDATDRVLEIGFGGGVNLPQLIQSAGFVAAVDRSRDMVRRAQSRFSQAVACGKAAFHEGKVEALPFDGSSFEKVITVNTIYFWESLDRCFEEIHRVLAPGGDVVVGFLPKEFMDRMELPSDIFASRNPDEVIAAMNKAGFTNVRIEKLQIDTAWLIVVARG